MRRAVPALTACLLLALPACSNEADRDAAAGAAPSSSSTAAPDATVTPGASSPGGAGLSGAAATTAPTGASGSAAATAAPPPAPRRTTPATVPSSAGAPAARKATAAGDYLFDSSGTVSLGGAPQPVEGTATLTVDPPTGATQHSVLKGDQGQTEQDVLVREAGTYLVRLQITNPAFDKAFEPEPAALLVPFPAAVGRTWAWSATSTDGKTTVRQSSEVVRKETLTIGGRKVATSVVQTALRLRGDISYDGQVTTWYAESLHLGVKERAKGSGTASGFAFTMDVTSVARSTTPA